MPTTNPREFNSGEEISNAALTENLNAMVRAIIQLQQAERRDPPIQEEADGAGGFFPVLLSELAGSGGDATTACSFTYSLYTLGGVLMDAGPFTPHWRPQTPGTLISGDEKIGMAYYDADGDLALYSASETIDALVCEGA